MTNFRSPTVVPGLILVLLACSLQGSCAKSPADPPRLSIDIFERAFGGESLESAEGGAVATRVDDLGKLKLPSGRIVAIEPFMAFDASPLSIRVPDFRLIRWKPGKYVAAAR